MLKPALLLSYISLTRDNSILAPSVYSVQEPAVPFGHMKLCFMMLTDLSKRFNFMNSTFQMANGYFEKHEKDLHQLSDQIWDNPELAFKEKFAHDLITDFFIEAGIGTVTKNYILDTAFKGISVIKFFTTYSNLSFSQPLIFFENFNDFYCL